MPLYLTFRVPANNGVFDSALSSALANVLNETSLTPVISTSM
jgi:hypothetical protein